MFDPYSSRGIRPAKKTISVGSELKRLLGGVFRFPLTLFLVIAPLLLAISGGLDLLVNWLYGISHHGLADTRPTVFLLDCLQDQSKKLCKGLYYGSVAGNVKIRLWPFLQPLNPAIWYLVLVGIAWMAFLSIGNPRLKPLGSFLTRVILLNFGNKNKEDEKRNRLIPWKNAKDPDEKSWVVGGVVTRLWDSDPGYFSFKQPDKDRPEPYLLSSRILQTNLTIVAPPGQGKTGSIFHPLVFYTRRIKGTSIFFDSKGNDFKPDYFDYNFDLNDPANSIKITLFSGATPAQAGERLSEALIPELGEDKQYFSNNAKDAMSTLVAAHHAYFNKMPELSELQHYLTYPTQLERLQSKVIGKLKGDRQPEALLLAAGIRRIIMLMENKNDILGSLATALSPFLTGPVSSLLVANSSITGNSYTIEELLKRPGLIRLGLSVADNPRLAPMISRLVLAQFTFTVLSPSCNTRIFKLAAVDEAHNFITPSIAKGMAHARSNNAGYALAVQTLSQIEEKGRSLLNTIFAASGTKIVMAGVGDEDAERFSRTFGEVELPYVTHSHSSSRSSGHSTGSSRSRGHELEFFAGGSGSEHRSSLGQSRHSTSNRLMGEANNEQLHLRRLFLPAEIRSLPIRHAIIEASDAFGHRWPAQVINMDRELVYRLEKQLAGKKTKREKEISQFEVSLDGAASSEKKKENEETALISPTLGKESLKVKEDKVSVSEGNNEKSNSVSMKDKPEENTNQVVEEKLGQMERVPGKASEREIEIIEVPIKANEDLSPKTDLDAKESEIKDPLEEIMFGKYEGEV